MADLRILDEAERWYQQSLDLASPDDKLGRGRCVAQLGLVAYERFKDAWSASRPDEELARTVVEAARLHEQALGMMPATAVAERAALHNMLGSISRNVSDINRALHHHRQSRAACYMVLGAVVLQIGAVVAQEQLLPYINGIDKTNRQQIKEIGILRTPSARSSCNSGSEETEAHTHARSKVQPARGASSLSQFSESHARAPAEILSCPFGRGNPGQPACEA
jgi:hypothetical protein